MIIVHLDDGKTIHVKGGVKMQRATIVPESTTGAYQVVDNQGTVLASFASAHFIGWELKDD